MTSQNQPALNTDYIVFYPISEGPDGYVVRAGERGIVNLNREDTHLAGWEMTEKDRHADIDALAVGPALDAAVAEYVYGYDVRDHIEVIIDPDLDAPLHWRAKDTGKIVMTPQRVPNYSEDLGLAREVEAEIERQGLVGPYVLYLSEELQISNGPRWDLKAIEVFALIHATPEQRSRAALKAVMGS